MQTILVINDGSAGAAGASETALSIAQRINADLLIVNVFKEIMPVRSAELVLAGGRGEQASDQQSRALRIKLAGLNADAASEFKPQIDFIDASGFSLNDLVHFINRNRIWMMIRGGGEPSDYVSSHMQSVLNRVACPLLLLPDEYRAKDFERIAYVADLRYCQIPVLNYLAHLAGYYHSRIQVAHIAAKGLPDMDERYAHSFFSDAICRKVKYDHLYFNNIREKNLQKVIDVLIHGMKTDMLVSVNRQFHFDELTGRSIDGRLPDHVTVPALIFPC